MRVVSLNGCAAGVVVRPPHVQNSRQNSEEDRPHPVGHRVGARRAKVAVGDGDGQHDRQNVHQKREQQVLGDQRDVDRRRRKDLGHEQEEHDQRQEDRDAHRHLLAGVGGQVEDADAEE